MKIGLISDIHGNLHALERVLDYLSMHDVGLILCAGDIVSYGAYPNQVIRRLREENVSCVAGNYDDAVAWDRPRASRQSSTPLNEPLKQAALDWSKKHVSPYNRQYLQSLPWISKFVIDGWTISLIHAGLDHLDEWHTPDSPDSLSLLASRLASDVVVLGHTHQAFTYYTERTRFVNPGAVGRSLDGDLRASYAILDTRQLKVDFLRVGYDVQAATQAIIDCGMPEEIAWMVRHGARRIEEVMTHENS
ncbi:MAG: metallophosphoesterase family protein [Chloroflexota bacterium]